MNFTRQISVFSLHLGLALFLFIGMNPVKAQHQDQKYIAPISGQGLENGLYALNEMDMHIHAGMERDLPLNEWIDYSVKDGRKVLVLLDHIELYRMDQKEHDAWVKKNNKTDWYPIGTKGHIALMNDFADAEKRNDVLTFRGWEISERELDGELEVEPMKMAEVIGWHISPNNGGPAPNGQTLLKRTQQIIKAQKQFPVPMILFHPFSMRIENLTRTAQKSGQDMASISVKDYLFFQPGEQAELIELLRGQSIYIEISKGLRHYWENEKVRKAVYQDVRPLVEAGVQFIVSTDAHGVKSLTKPFNPKYYCDELGITPENTNTIVRELLAIRVKNTLVK